MAELSEIKMFSAYREHLCMKHTQGTARLCFTKKCPLAKIGCFYYVSFASMYQNLGYRKRQDVDELMRGLIESDEEWVYDK